MEIAYENEIYAVYCKLESEQQNQKIEMDNKTLDDTNRMCARLYCSTSIVK